MINKFFKIVHTKYLKLFRFVFFIRYLLVIFIISFALFLIIPIFFDYEKRIEVIKSHLLKNYNLQIEKYESIKFVILPYPNLELNNVKVNFNTSSIKVNIKNFKIHPKLLSIYNYEKFETNKIVLKNSDISTDVSDINLFIKKILNYKNKIIINNLNLTIKNKNKSIIKLKSINFSNYGYKKNLVTGEVFENKFKTKLSNDYKNINFKLINSGINFDINYEKEKENIYQGIFKSKILNTNIKFNFILNKNILNIKNTFLRNKNISLKNKSIITFEPFFHINNKFEIEDINPKMFKKLNFNKLLESKSIIKKINSKNEIIYKSKKFNRGLIDSSNLKFDLAYGRINFSKIFFISKNSFDCRGNANLLEEFPVVFFDCLIETDDKQNLLKQFSIKTKNKSEPMKLQFQGNLSLLNNKINFKTVSMNEKYNASSEDLRYFKNSFESIILNESFLDIFSLKKIKNFILEIS